MNCIKCGKEVPEMQVFCEDCLADMEQYPVKPDVTVSLPHREESSAGKKNRRQKTLSPEEQLRRTKYTLRLTRIALAVVFICFLLVSAMLLQHLYV